MSMTKSAFPAHSIEHKIVLIRGQKVILDRDLAELYGVQTKVLNQAVKRNPARFPNDFMFRLVPEEDDVLRFQFGISNDEPAGGASGRGGRRYLPYAFTEQGVAMLSGVLNSERAVLVNVDPMRAEYDFSKGKRGAVVKGKTRISIYLDNAVLGEFRALAEKAGMGYQTMINEALRNHLERAQQPVTEQVLRNVLRQELPEYLGHSAGRRAGKRARSQGA
jgi:uncharacterized protein (DUF4415 family)